MTFGEYDYNQIEGGENGLNQYLNKADNQWAIMMDDVKYGNIDI